MRRGGLSILSWQFLPIYISPPTLFYQRRIWMISKEKNCNKIYILKRKSWRDSSMSLVFVYGTYCSILTFLEGTVSVGDLKCCSLPPFPGLQLECHILRILLINYLKTSYWIWMSRNYLSKNVRHVKSYYCYYYSVLLLILMVEFVNIWTFQ